MIDRTKDIDPEETRLGLVAFSSADRFDPPLPGLSAWTETGLTRDLEALSEGLDRIEQEGARGSTDMAAGLDRAVDTLWEVSERETGVPFVVPAVT